MAGFAQSFEKSFIPAAKSSSDATLEMLKEKIKTDAAKAEEKSKIASGKAALAMQHAQVTGVEDPEFLKGLSNINDMDALKMVSTGITTAQDLAMKNKKLSEEILFKNQELAQKKAIADQTTAMDMLKEYFVPATKDDISKSIVEASMAANKSGKTSLVQMGDQAFVPMQKTEKEKALSPSLQSSKRKDTSDLFKTFETNKVRLEQAKDIEGLFETLPKGLTGKALTNYLKNLDSEDPRLGAWQNLKNWLADEQLSFVAKTKGAVSDTEMAFFREAVGNDDLSSTPRFKAILKKFTEGMKADQRAKVASFRQNYKEDPAQWDELKQFFGEDNSSSTKTTPNAEADSFLKGLGV